MKDSMSLLSGVAASYQTMPLSMLHQLQSVLTIEINQRLLEFGEIKVEKDLVSVGDVEGKKTVFSVGNVQEKNVIHVNFKRD
jgi:hypothetical protein